MLFRAAAPRPDLGWTAALPWIGYALILGAVGGLRWEHVVIAAGVTAVAAGGARGRTLFTHALPFFVLFLLYDSMRYWGRIGADPSRVLGCGLRDAELAWFGVDVGGARHTLNDLFVTHHHPAIDLLCAIPYGSYIPVMLATFVWLYRRDRPAAQRFAWMVLATHVLGFVTYHFAPAAPPWYVRARGCVIDPTAATDGAAGLRRVDALLGFPYFHALYARGSAVFGALPSLHVTYPLYGLFALRRCHPATRCAQVLYAAVMIFAAIYLDHHYVVDVLLGITYALVGFAAVSFYFARDRGGVAPGETPTGTSRSCRGS